MFNVKEKQVCRQFALMGLDLLNRMNESLCPCAHYNDPPNPTVDPSSNYLKIIDQIRDGFEALMHECNVTVEEQNKWITTRQT